MPWFKELNCPDLLKRKFYGFGKDITLTDVMP